MGRFAGNACRANAVCAWSCLSRSARSRWLSGMAATGISERGSCRRRPVLRRSTGALRALWSTGSSVSRSTGGIRPSGLRASRIRAGRLSAAGLSTDWLSRKLSARGLHAAGLSAAACRPALFAGSDLWITGWACAPAKLGRARRGSADSGHSRRARSSASATARSPARPRIGCRRTPQAAIRCGAGGEASAKVADDADPGCWRRAGAARRGARLGGNCGNER